MINSQQKLRSKLKNPGWGLSADLFGEEMLVADFSPVRWVYFLDHIGSIRDLVRGLEELSPLADDALLVAQAMNEQEFAEFKLALARERRVATGEIGESNFPSKYLLLLYPALFMPASMLAQQFHVCLGASLIRMVELGLETRWSNSKPLQ